MSDAIAPIGIFDSGMGGLTVMRALRARLPNENLRLSGRHGAAALRHQERRHGDALCRAGGARPDRAATSRCWSWPATRRPASRCRRWKQALAPLPVIGVIEPGAEAAVAAAPGRPIAVIATEGTVKGGAYVRAIQALRAQHAGRAAGLPAVRAAGGRRPGRRARSRELAAQRYLDPLLATMPRPRALVLGCTHFPALKETIAEVAGPDVDAGRQRRDHAPKRWRRFLQEQRLLQ